MTNKLAEKIKNRESGIVLYGLVPPKSSTDKQRVAEIASLQKERLQGLAIDGLILYDIQDEEARISAERPFPYLETLDPFDYAREHLADFDSPKVIYRSVGKYTESGLENFLDNAEQQDNLAVFVGAAATDQKVNISMKQAYQVKAAHKPDLPLGGVVIPERHLSKKNEHTRVFEKMTSGCSFFVSQGVYDVTASLNFLSDYYYYGKEHNIPLVPIIFTLTPCGSAKTLDFMKWLGISVPRWMENELTHADDILQLSVDFAEQNWRVLKAFADEKGIPVGINIESVAVRKVEVEASIDLLTRLTN